MIPFLAIFSGRGKLLTWLALIALCLAFWAGVAYWFTHRDKAHVDEGRQLERAEQNAIQLDKVEQAHDAETEIMRNPVARASGCVRHSRTPENCGQ